VSEVPKTATYTRAYAESNGFLTLLRDGERLTGAARLPTVSTSSISAALISRRSNGG
jgi:dihydrolipoamide dehydrogenase